MPTRPLIYLHSVVQPKHCDSHRLGKYMKRRGGRTKRGAAHVEHHHGVKNLRGRDVALLLLPAIFPSVEVVVSSACGRKISISQSPWFLRRILSPALLSLSQAPSPPSLLRCQSPPHHPTPTPLQNLPAPGPTLPPPPPQRLGPLRRPSSPPSLPRPLRPHRQPRPPHHPPVAARAPG